MDAKEKLLKIIEIAQLGLENGIPASAVLDIERNLDEWEKRITPTRWSIDDIRDRFPKGTSDEELYEELLSIENGFKNNAVMNGWDVINELLKINEDDDNVEDDEMATCAVCGKNYHENDVNMIDYDIDICIHCEGKMKS